MKGISVINAAYCLTSTLLLTSSNFYVTRAATEQNSGDDSHVVINTSFTEQQEEKSAVSSTNNDILSRLAKALGDRIKHVIVLMEENRSFDHFFGYAAELLGVDGVKGDEYQLKDLSDPSKGRVNIDDKSPYCGLCDPDHGTPATTKKVYGLGNVSAGDPATMDGFIAFEEAKGQRRRDWCGVMSMFPPERIPVITKLAQEFAVMDRFFCSHPGPTWPNRMYALAATSAGSTSTGTWYNNTPGLLFPQRTILDQVVASGRIAKNYYNDTPWEMFMESIAHHPERLSPMETFFEDAASGNLPSFAWINPRSGVNVTTGVGSNDQHPDHDVALGERYMKDIYEALRAGPAWNETLFIITMDEHGGFWDHVPPPAAPPPSKNMPNSYPDHDFFYDRLGVRIPTLLISPWIKAGTVISAPPAAQKPSPTSEYDLTSIMATSRILLGMNESDSLTDRDAWAATFEHAFVELTAPRTDCLMHLPDAPPPSLDAHVEAALPINDLQRDISFIHAHLANVQGDVNHTTSTHSGVPQTQGLISEWMQLRFNEHVTDYAQQPVICDVSSRKAGWRDTKWYYNVSSSTISTTTLRSPTGSPYCLTGQNVRYISTDSNTTVYASLCASAERIDDANQRWVIAKDATIRLVMSDNGNADESLWCLANENPVGIDPSTKVLVQTCDSQSVLQHWAYHGPNSKDGGAGVIQFGDDANCLGIPR
jgi:phospholipase C